MSPDPEPPLKIVLCHSVREADLERARHAFPHHRWEVAEKGHIAQALEDAEIAYGPLKPEDLAVARKLKWLQSSSAGVEKLARAPVFQQGSFILTTAAGMHESCAEHAVALLLAVSRQVGLYQRAPGPGIWAARGKNPQPRVLAGRTLGLLGLGEVGRRIGRIARALGLHVVGLSFSGRPVPEAGEVFRIEELDRLLPGED